MSKGARRRAVLATVVALVAIGIWAAVARPGAGPAGGPTSTTHAEGTSGNSAGSAEAAGATFPGPDGVEAAWVVAENRKPGTTGWRIGGAQKGTIAGFSDHVYAQVGNTVTLSVTTDARSFRVDAYRMGYYGGDGARLVWSSPSEVGRVQPACTVAPATNMVACDDWSPSLRFVVSPAFVQGDYLLKLVGSGGQASYVPLTVWDPTSQATYVVKNDVYTWQAWNPYGGYDFYQGLGSCPSDVYPVCSRARVVSFDRPYGYGQGAGDFLGSEYPLVRYAEQHGLDVTYATDLNLEQDAGFLLDHKVLLSLGHDECWSLPEREAAVTAEEHGVNIVFFAASPMLRHVRLQASPLGRDREVVDYRDSSADPLDGRGNPLEVTGNTWSSTPASWSEVPFVGEAYSGFLEPGVPLEPFVVADASAWIFRGTGLHDGSMVAGVLATDFDQFDPGTHPANLQILGHSPIDAALAQTQASKPYSDMTYYTDPKSGAGVFDSGINSWIPALSPCPPSASSCPATLVGKITGNLLALFGEGPAGRHEPSVANWRRIDG